MEKVKLVAKKICEHSLKFAVHPSPNTTIEPELRTNVNIKIQHSYIFCNDKQSLEKLNKEKG